MLCGTENKRKLTFCLSIVDKNGKKLDEIAQQFQGQIYDNQWLGVSISSTGSGAFSVSTCDL